MMSKRILTLFTALLMTVSAALICTCAVPQAEAAEAYIDNSALVPAWKPDSEVTTDDNNTPDWTSSLIMMTVNPYNASKEGTLMGMLPMLDHLQEMGVNGLWLCPIYDRGRTAEGQPVGNGYSNMGVDTIDPQLTGTTDYEQGFQVLKQFIDEAHKRNIRIILDVIAWGTVKTSPLYESHSDWYTVNEAWGGYLFDWGNSELQEWYVENVVDLVLKTGCDGLRYDLAPSYGGYSIHGDVKVRLLKQGRKILTIAEGFNDRGAVYDLDQNGVSNPDGLDGRDMFDHWETVPMLNEYNMVDCIKNGENIGSYASISVGDGATYRYYTNMISCHDMTQYVAKQNRLVMGYNAIYSPFIPLWYLGEETGCTKSEGAAVLFDKYVNWQEQLEDPEIRAYYEDVKRMIRIRRTYTDLFEYYPAQFKDTNICKVNVANCEALQPYARYAGDTAILVIPNYNIHNPNAEMTVYMPFKATGLDYYKKYTVTDAETGEVIVSGSAAKVASFKVRVPNNDQRVFVVKAQGKIVIQNGEQTEDTVYSDNETADTGDCVSTDTETEKKGQKTVAVKKVYRRKKTGDALPIWPFALGGAGVVAAAGTVTAVLIIRKRKKAKAGMAGDQK